MKSLAFLSDLRQGGVRRRAGRHRDVRGNARPCERPAAPLHIRGRQRPVLIKNHWNRCRTAFLNVAYCRVRQVQPGQDDDTHY